MNSSLNQPLTTFTQKRPWVYWSELATILVEETLKLVRHRRHYRDDMALTGIYVPES